MKQKKLESALSHGKEMLDVFGGEHAEFINVAVECIEKHIPMKPTKDRLYHCPKCYGLIGKRFQFCVDCGQAIDWSDDGQAET